MIDKFDIPETVPIDSPLIRLSLSWYDFSTELGRCKPTLARKFGEIRDQTIFKSSPGVETTFAYEAAVVMGHINPSLVVALNGMHMALDEMVGWQIRWRHHRSDRIAAVSDVQEGILGQSMLEADPDPANTDLIKTWVNVADGPDSPMMSHSLHWMSAIYAEPPK